MIKRDMIPMEDAQAAIAPIVEAALAAIDGIPAKLPTDTDPTVRRLVEALASSARKDFLDHMRAAAITLGALDKAMNDGRSER